MREEPTQIAIAIVERGGDFLVGTRPPGKSLAGYAEFPGGRVEPGETVEGAAIRECLEETGLSVVVIGCFEECRHDYEHDRVHLHFLRCRLNGDTDLPRSPFRWVPRDDLGTLNFPEANLAILKRLAAKEPTLE
ncbi:MAG: (deoxy)nucleoside triphosphate pyrophosphohydrolase [Planctomycetaceae bacterium]|nr:(deoxy)nucleoside triphosphate pyrophosphohydrolase [Planctomycetales bacterium]MCB9936740.1 (deoxy)nucleoside triphosphate pyrophosphohydrolase [Planctomycetaceae bacterium]